MAKISLIDLLGGSIAQINNNFTLIKNIINNRILFRDNPDGEPNQMLTTLDMNNQRVLNLPAPVSDHEPVRLIDVQGPVGDLAAAVAAAQVAAGAAQASANAIANVGLPTGSSFVGFLHNAVGAVTRTVLSKLRDSRVNVKDFGATGLSTGDDTQAFALARAVTSSYYIPDGTYVLNASPDPFLDNFSAGSNVTLVVGGVSYNVSNAFSGGLRYNRTSASKLDVVDAKTGNTVMYYQNGAPGTATGFYRGLSIQTDSHFLQAGPATANGSVDLLFQRSAIHPTDPAGNRINWTYEGSTDRLLMSVATTANGFPSFDTAIAFYPGVGARVEFPAIQPRFSQGWKVTTRSDGNFELVTTPATDRVHFEKSDGSFRYLTLQTNGAMGFFGSGGVTKPIISGSRGSMSPASLSMLAAMSSLGLATDATTA